MVRPSRPIDIIQGGVGTTPVDLNVQLSITNGGETFNYCSEFTDCIRKVIAGGTGAKVACKSKNSVPRDLVVCPGSASGAFLDQ